MSREHCRIRREPETGRFTIEDVSQFGTAVNGKPVGQNATAELPRRAHHQPRRRDRPAMGSGLMDTWVGIAPAVRRPQRAR